MLFLPTEDIVTVFIKFINNLWSWGHQNLLSSRKIWQQLQLKFTVKGFWITICWIHLKHFWQILDLASCLRETLLSITILGNKWHKLTPSENKTREQIQRECTSCLKLLAEIFTGYQSCGRIHNLIHIITDRDWHNCSYMSKCTLYIFYLAKEL